MSHSGRGSSGPQHGLSSTQQPHSQTPGRPAFPNVTPTFSSSTPAFPRPPNAAHTGHSAVGTNSAADASGPSVKPPRFPAYRPLHLETSTFRPNAPGVAPPSASGVSAPSLNPPQVPTYNVHTHQNSSSGSNPNSSNSDSPSDAPAKPFNLQPPKADVPSAHSVPILPSDPQPPSKKFPNPPVGVSLDTAKDIQAQQELTSVKSNHIYTPDEFVVEPQGVAGEVVQKLGLLAYVLFFVVPLGYVALFFAIIPLGDPTKPGIKYQWVFIFVSNTCIMLAVAYLYNAAFLSLARCKRPFRTSIIPLVSVVVTQIAIATPVLLTNGVFKFFGIYALALCYLTLFVSMLVAYWDMRQLVHSFFRRFMTLLILYIPLLGLFVIGYRHANAVSYQAILSFFFAFLTFVYRRMMLSRLDPFPLNESQLFAGFWVQNLGDCTQILALPQVSSPSVFGAIFAANSIANIALLVFVTDWWIYKIRPGLKTNVKNAFKFNFPIPPPPKPDESFDSVNRGHDNNVGGYRRRQFRFFFYRMLSQAIAMVMYLGISPMLRYGLNKEHSPLHYFTPAMYTNSLIYAGANVGFIAAVTVFGYAYLHHRHPETFREIREIHRHDFVHHNMVGMIIAIITHNMVLTIAIILSQYCIFNAFLACTYKDFEKILWHHCCQCRAERETMHSYYGSWNHSASRN